MGASGSKDEIKSYYIPKRIIDTEIGFLKAFQTCPSSLKTEIEQDLQLMLTSLNGNLQNPINVLDSLGKGILDPKQEDEIKAVMLDRINEYMLAKELDDRFFNSKLMSVITCLYGNLWTVDRNLFKATESTQHYFRVTEDLSLGQWGMVTRGELGGSNLKFIIRTQTDHKDVELSIHELFLGLTTINPLRALCPNFSCIYGGFICGRQDAISAKICAGEAAVPYTVYENIEGPALNSLIKEIDDRKNITLDGLDDFYSTVLSELLQIFFSLKIAHAEANDFAHRDLHTGNIIMRPLEKEMWIRYDSKDMILDDAISKMKRRQGLLGPKNRDLKQRTVYYVRATDVATIIDYDMGEIYAPSPDPQTGEIKETQFGKNDHDPSGMKWITGDKTLSKIRDLNKMLGFVAYYALVNPNINDQFKNLLMDLYINTVKPYYTDLSGNAYKPTFEDKRNLIMKDVDDYFRVTSTQYTYIQNGHINFDRFLLIFRRHVPAHYLRHLLIEHVSQNMNLESSQEEADVMKPVNGQVFGCNGVCPSEVEVYKTLAHHPFHRPSDGEDRPSTDADAVYAMDREMYSYQRLSETKINVLSQSDLNPQEPPKVIKYKDVVATRLSEAAAAINDSNIDVIMQDIEDMIARINRRLEVIVPSNTSIVQAATSKTKIVYTLNFEYKETIYPVKVYKDVFEHFFKIIKFMRDVILYHNAMVFAGASEKVNLSKQRVSVIETSRLVIDYVSTVMVPYRNEFLKLVTAKAFGEHTGELASVIATKFPDSITLDAIY